MRRAWLSASLGLEAAASAVSGEQTWGHEAGRSASHRPKQQPAPGSAAAQQKADEPLAQGLCWFGKFQEEARGVASQGGAQGPLISYLTFLQQNSPAREPTLNTRLFF